MHFEHVERVSSEVKRKIGNIMPVGVDFFGKKLSKKLSEEMKTIFHQTVAQGSFSCKRARPDMQPTTSVSCTQLKSPGHKDWGMSV